MHDASTLNHDTEKLSADATAHVHMLPIEWIMRDPRQARTHFADDALAELTASIHTSGIIQPIVVSGNTEQGYQLIAGERRWRAAQRAGLAQIPAIVRNDLDSEQATIFGLIENLQRESLGTMDTAHALARLGDDHGLTHDAIASRIGKSRAYVSNFLRLRQLESSVQTLLNEGRLSIGHGKVLAGLSPAKQLGMAHEVIRKRASVRTLERWAQQSQATAQSSPDTSARQELDTLEQQLTEQLGNAVKIHYHPERHRGELHITFHDLNEFDGILERLGFTRT